MSKSAVCLGVLEDDDAWSTPIINSIRTQNPECVIRTAVDGKSFCRLLSEHPAPRLVILDINVVGMNGIEVLQLIRSRTDLAKVPVVMLTTYDDIALETKCLKYGANGYYRKKVDNIPCTIREVIANHLYTGDDYIEVIYPPLLNESAPSLSGGDDGSIDDFLDDL